MCHRVFKSFHLNVICISSSFLLLVIPSIESFMWIFVAQISQWVEMPNACQWVGVLDSYYSQSYGFFRSHVWIWELDHKESWAPKNWCFWIVVLEKTLKSPLGCKEIKPVNPKRNQPRIFIGRSDNEMEAPILWPPDVKSWLIGKDSDAGKYWGHKEKEVAEDEIG